MKWRISSEEAYKTHVSSILFAVPSTSPIHHLRNATQNFSNGGTGRTGSTNNLLLSPLLLPIKQSADVSTEWLAFFGEWVAYFNWLLLDYFPHDESFRFHLRETSGEDFLIDVPYLIFDGSKCFMSIVHGFQDHHDPFFVDEIQYLSDVTIFFHKISCKKKLSKYTKLGFIIYINYIFATQ